MAAALFVLIAADEERTKLQRIRKTLRDLSDPFTIQESQFRLLYRLSKDAVRELCAQLRPYVEQEVRATAIPFELKAHIKEELAKTFYHVCANPLLVKLFTK
ncbi:uncharacterized protein LOC112455865 [Temnothorax curvispinosus]|uniref:Uncharacterized protein LOC112455865 n=1 Tax=Temnothorax curvispinosus TaxID=300111 RepID=A0A6J1PVC9_9HYME|nr:uncharacterized protein LOC112455865 [Temnothorax curvispinosus]